jgi:hypothetical protein
MSRGLRTHLGGNVLRNAADILMLAASPIFGSMALLTSQYGGMRDAFCGPIIGLPWNEMVAMYVLMCIVHLTPWMKMLARSRSCAPAANTENSGT